MLSFVFTCDGYKQSILYVSSFVLQKPARIYFAPSARVPTWRPPSKYTSQISLHIFPIRFCNVTTTSVMPFTH